ncbi:MAG: hypothetical protein KDA24_18190 [Deltaproteobacteria bacterium]|nr:hypothetical protein [Deltaproteobacteria bacterium]
MAASSPTLLRSAAALGLLGVLLSGCGETERAFAGLDGPGDVALLEPGEFFEVPVGFVSNFRSGRVSKLDLKRTRLLVEDGPAAWMPAPDFSFGADRALSQIALAERPGELDIWVSDDMADSLLRGPYVRMGDDGVPVWSRPSLVDGPTVLDASGAAKSGTVPQLRGLRIRPGRATTETWTFTWMGRYYEARGTASGLQRARVVPGSHTQLDAGQLAFQLSLDGAEPAMGDQIVLTVDSGIEEADAGGLVMDIRTSLDGEWVFAAVLPDDGRGFVSVWDAINFTEIDRLALPLGSVPEALALGMDDGVLWVADSAEIGDAGQIHRLDYLPGDVDSLAVTTIPVPEPNVDVAEGRDPEADRVFVGAAYTDALWMLDGLTYEVIDINTWTPEIDPMNLSAGSLGQGAPISGLAATPGAAKTWQVDERGERLPRYGVLATTFAGTMYWIDAASGCLIHDLPANAFLDIAGGNEDSAFRDVGNPSDPVLFYDDEADSAMTTHPCGGVTLTEVWTFLYRETLQAYEVSGSRSGEQQGLAYEGERYVSDKGEISVLLLPGNAATTEGDAWAFPVNDGVTPVPVQQLPGDPAVYTELYDDRSGAYWKLRERQVVIVPHVSNDIVLWIELAGQGNGPRIYQ